VVGSKAKNGGGDVSALNSAPVPVAAKSDDAERRHWGIPGDFPDHMEASNGDAVSPTSSDTSATDKKRGIFSMFRRKKNTKPSTVVMLTVSEYRPV